ncbi:AAA family ATPase [Schnuerera ultunensis]|uniref:AAA family ATPase n=1 Tax=Schnuerera ultunensis TaxID=45497 RepID=UPI000D6E6F34|nr:AAA family ATPase [Schnuerera ultunensis]
MLRAKRSEAEIIVLDDPISSFDSIYKNKIAFIIVKFLEGKKQVILTHNTELIKLLAHQKRDCFNLYLFNNAKENEVNGFIRVNSKEQEILLYLDKLLDLFRDTIYEEIKNEKNFLVSMIPFMRGYSKMIASSEADNLSWKLKIRWYSIFDV